MNKPILAKSILTAALLAGLVWGMWLIPLEPPRGSLGQSEDETWNPPPAAPPEDIRQLAQNIAARQGWNKDAESAGKAGAGGGGKGAPGQAGGRGTAAGGILGISRVGADAAILVAEDSAIRAYRPGETLPDGRRILDIQDLDAQLAGPDGEQTVRLFAYEGPATPAPP